MGQETSSQPYPFVLSTLLLLAILAGLGFNLSLVAQPAEGSTPAQRFFKAEQAFDQALSLDALDRSQAMLKVAQLFESIAIANKINNGHLEYNMANAYQMARQAGPAMLHYQRAMRLLPNSVELQSNLATLKRHSGLDEPPKSQWNQVLFDFFSRHFMLASSQRLKLALLFWCMGWAGWLLWRFTNKTWIKSIIWVMAVLFVLSLGSVGMDEYSSRFSPQGVLMLDGQKGFKGPSFNYEAAFKSALPQGMLFEILERREGWLKLQQAQGSLFWLPKNAVDRI